METDRQAVDLSEVSGSHAMTQPLDLDYLRACCAVVAHPDSEYAMETARRTLAAAVPQLLDLLAAATARAEAAELRADTAIAEAVTIAHMIGHEDLAAEVRRLRQERDDYRATLEQIAKRDDTEMAAARILHYDMRGWARAALTEGKASQ